MAARRPRQALRAPQAVLRFSRAESAASTLRRVGLQSAKNDVNAFATQMLGALNTSSSQRKCLFRDFCRTWEGSTEASVALPQLVHAPSTKWEARPLTSTPPASQPQTHIYCAPIPTSVSPCSPHVKPVAAPERQGMLRRHWCAVGSLALAKVVTLGHPSLSLQTATAGDADQEAPLFSKLLVANRGEIACRVIRTAKRLGIPTVAIYSDPDVEALHVRMADEAVRVGPAAPTLSYLSIDAILQAAEATGASALHPGYGFLSENAGFVRRLEEEAKGLTFVGPRASAIQSMGDKIESKQLAKAAGVNTIPGVEEVIQDQEHAVSIARKVGFPVMLKASGGGGGKGMRIARDEYEVGQLFSLCRAEAESSFADPRIFIERYIEQPRHIEIQVMGDNFGNVVWLPERECSIQRRNQKIIEEAPSPFLSEQVRQAMGEQAVALAKAVDYNSAGTVEFLVDSKANFFFLEMNTRLQVEHPVTECITGLDLVELMLRVASGSPLPSLTPSLSLSQERASKVHGWAMETRVCCEQPGLMFLPSAGVLSTYMEPSPVEEVDQVIRVDSGVTEGTEVTVHYDPLIAKVITWGPSRDVAIVKMQEALDQYLVEGPSNNIAFARCVTAHPAFVAGKLSTQFLPEHFPMGEAPSVLTDPRLTREAAAVAALLHILREKSAMSPVLPREELQKASTAPIHLTAVIQGSPINLSVEHWPLAHDPSLIFMEAEFEEERILVTQRFPWGSERGGRAKGIVELDVDGKATFCQIRQRLPRGFRLTYKGAAVDEVLVMPRPFARLQGLMHRPKETETSRLIKSPMPGAIVGIAVELNQEVAPGEEVITIEAMKMRNVLRAEKPGKVVGIFVKIGQLVKPGEQLVEIDTTP